MTVKKERTAAATEPQQARDRGIPSTVCKIIYLPMSHTQSAAGQATEQECDCAPTESKADRHTSSYFVFHRPGANRVNVDSLGGLHFLGRPAR